MSHLVEKLLQEASFGHMLSGSTVARFLPSEIRQAVQELVGEERIDMADALVEAGLALHPNSADILAIGAFLGSFCFLAATPPKPPAYIGGSAKTASFSA